MKTIYLAGAMKGLTWEQAGEWRKEFSRKLPNHIATLSPLRGKMLDITENYPVIQNSYEENPITSATGINVRDFNDVKTCDLVVANLVGMHDKSVGTIMEIAWTRCWDKPCILIADWDDKEAWYDHPMLQHENILCKSLDQAVSVAVSLLSNDLQVGELAEEDRNPEGIPNDIKGAVV